MKKGRPVHVTRELDSVMGDEMKYRNLKKGEIIQEGDEVDACVDGWRDDPIWEKAETCIGEPAPDPTCPSHRIYRRVVK